MLNKNKTYLSTVSHIKKNGDAVIQLPKEMCKEYGVRSGDSYFIEVVDMKFVMTFFVNYSRLKREWKKYMRRMEIFDISFKVVRANRVIGNLKPSKLEYHIEQFE